MCQHLTFFFLYIWMFNFGSSSQDIAPTLEYEQRKQEWKFKSSSLSASHYPWQNSWQLLRLNRVIAIRFGDNGFHLFCFFIMIFILMQQVAPTIVDRGQKRKLNLNRLVVSPTELSSNCLPTSQILNVIYTIIYHHSFTSEKLVLYLSKNLSFVFYPCLSFWLKYYQYDDIILVIFSCIIHIIYFISHKQH